jgi:hypothetical protein
MSNFNFVGGVAKKKKNLNLAVKFIFSRSHTKHNWELLGVLL